MPPPPPVDASEDASPPPTRRAAGSLTPPRGLPSSRAAVGGLLVAIAAIGTWLAATGADAGPADRYVVARRAVAAGETLTAADLTTVEVELSDHLRRRAFASPDDVVGAVTRGRLGAGELVQAGSVTDGARADAPAELSFSVDPRWAVAGVLDVGDRIDVFATLDDRTTRVLHHVVVLRLGAADEGLGGDGAQTVTVAVDGDAEVGEVVGSLRRAEVTVVRLNGRPRP